MESAYCNVMKKISLTDKRKAEMIRNCAEKVRIRSVPRKMVKVAIALCVTVVLACTTVAAVNEQKRTTWKDVYDSYEMVVEEVSEKYGCELSLATFTNMRLQIPVEEFHDMLEQYCSEIQTFTQQIPSEGESVKKVSYTIIHPYAMDAVFVTVYGAFDILKNEDLMYSFTPESFSIKTRGVKGTLAYRIVGEPEVEQIASDNYVVKQQFHILNYGIYESTTILRIEFRIDPVTGVIYMSE